MNTQVQIGNLVWTVPGISKEDVHKLAEKKHWVIRELGNHGTIDAPVTIGNWRYEPLGDSTLPRLAAQRKNLILKSGEPLQWIVGHDLTEHKPLINIPWSMVLKVAGIAIGMAMAAVVVSVLLAALVAVLAPVVLVLGALAVCATGDPALICVTVEGEWEEIYRDYSDNSW